MKEQNKDALRETVAALISLLLIGAAAFLWHALYALATDKTAPAGSFDRVKDVLQSVLPFAGTAVGYYLGRIPAERAADRAQRQLMESIQAMREK